MTEDPFSPDRVSDTARRMLARYSSAKVAAEMAWQHACSHQVGSPPAVYWRRVSEQINRLRDQANRGTA